MARKHDYMLLSRLLCDCKYYLGNGNRSARCLWACDEQEQINKMRELWDGMPENGKPEWLTREEIDNYAKQMGVK